MWRDRRPALLAALLLSAVVQGDMMTYNRNNKQLFFRCPIKDLIYPNDKFMFIQLARISSPAIILANWTASIGPYYDEDQVTPIDAELPSLLAARMDHVTCRDSATYRCFTSVDSKKKGVYNMVDHIEFKYEGEITTPVLRTTPRTSRFKEKDTVTFECKARIGREQNTFVWETRLPGESFTQVNDTGSLSIKMKQETKTTPTCDIEAVTTLELKLNANDDMRVYRCRLQESNHTDFYTLSVECLDGNNCLVPCGYQSSAKPEEVTASEDVPYDPNPVSNVGASCNKTEERPSESGASSISTFLVLITVLPITATIALIAAILLRRTMCIKQVPPLVVMESPAPTEHGGSVTCPLLPHPAPPAVCRTSTPAPPAATATPLPTPLPTTTTPTRK